MAEESTARFCKKEYDIDTGLVSFNFGNGEVVDILLQEVTGDAAKMLPIHGLLQKGGDSFAGAKGDFTAAITSLKSVLAGLRAGVWNAGRGEGEGRPRLGELAEAIARIKAVPVEQAMAAVEKASDEQRKTWRGNAKVKSVIATIRAEAAAKALEAAGEQELEVAL